MPSSKIRPEDTPKAKEILLKIEESKILVKKITTEALATPTSEELVKDKINSVLKSCKDFLSDYGANYQELIKSSYNGLKSLANRCLNEVQSFFKNNKDNLLAKNLAQAFAKSDKHKKTVNRTFVINGGEATLEEDMSVKFKETSGEFGYDQMIIDDYQARVKEAINTISKQTLTEKTFREVNGRKVGAPVFVSIRNKAEMAVRYDAMKEELKELVADKEQYVIVSQHADASLRCSPLQGLLYKLDVNPEEHVKVVLSSKELGSKKPKEIGKVDGNPYYSLKEAMSYGLFSYNCRHRFIKYIPGQKITPQYQYDSKAAEAKREIDTNMRTLERQIRMLKEREVLSLDSKERKAYIKASKQAQAKYRAYAQKHGRVINEWRCSITRSERAVRKLTKTSQSDKINIEVDELTPCLKNAKDGTIVDTNISPFSPTKQNTKNWEFDWTLEKKQNRDIYALRVNGDDDVKGLISLSIDKKDYQAVMVHLVESSPQNNPHNKKFKSKEFSGIGGHLFAYAVKLSFENNLDGYVFFTAKTRLIDHYSKELGAKLLNGKGDMFIETKEAKALYERYYGKGH